MNALAHAQDALQGWLLQGDAGIAALLDGEQRPHRLRVYADAYRLRLIDVLANDFPATRDALGDAPFQAIALGYIDAHPSTRPSVRHFGRSFANWLQAHPDARRGLHELARFEWLQGECFDAADARPLAIDDVAAMPAEAWPSLRLALHPATRMLASRRLRLHDGRPRLATRDAPTAWVLWRDGVDVRWRSLDRDEAEALQALREGAAFGALCERLANHHGEAGALRAAALLKRWLADGLLATTTHPHSD